MRDLGKLKQSDYNFPIVRIYKYKTPARLRGADKEATMPVEFACALRAEFIPEGMTKGPVRILYFKVFKAGSCSINGAVLGWPSLDSPVVAKSEGLGWRTKPDGFEYTALGVTIPRTDDVRRVQYVANIIRYYMVNENTEPESLCGEPGCWRQMSSPSAEKEST